MWLLHRKSIKYKVVAFLVKIKITRNLKKYHPEVRVYHTHCQCLVHWITQISSTIILTINISISFLITMIIIIELYQYQQEVTSKYLSLSLCFSTKYKWYLKHNKSTTNCPYNSKRTLTFRFSRTQQCNRMEEVNLWRSY